MNQAVGLEINGWCRHPGRRPPSLRCGGSFPWAPMGIVKWVGLFFFFYLEAVFLFFLLFWSRFLFVDSFNFQLLRLLSARDGLGAK